jgi:hypothetical protein
MSDDLLCTWTTLPPTWLLPMLGQPSFMQWSVVFQRTHVFQDTNCSTGTPNVFITLTTTIFGLPFNFTWTHGLIPVELCDLDIVFIVP